MKRFYRAALAVSASLGVAGATMAQGPIHRSPVERQVLVQLSYALGEAHALHRLCAGPNDATWYARMQKLEQEEGADDNFRRQLVESFNAGYAADAAQFPRCSAASQAAERDAAAHGATLARNLAAGLPDRGE
ncbi:MAG: TIGR02301 family protein [Caulobacteraceae bacterium]